jgi:hypothetical protein
MKRFTSPQAIFLSKEHYGLLTSRFSSEVFARSVPGFLEVGIPKVPSNISEVDEKEPASRRTVPIPSGHGKVKRGERLDECNKIKHIIE